MMISNSVLFKLFAFVCLFVPLLASSEEKTCAEVTVRDYKYTNSYNLSSIFNSQLDESIDTKNSDLIKGVSSEEYLVKLPVTFETRRGDIHVAFSEFPYSENSNRVYEFLLGGYENTLFEIRRKDYLHEKRNFNGNRFSDHSVPIYEEFNVEFSISKNGVVQLRDLDTDFKFNFTDQLPVIPVSPQ
ncbi:hypothetical protein Bhyg_05856 [Pseudolycoriella hygida]|uniref:Farnesoic acid O-methyl transferase domain-containing protein n=1 Tax=Pseudolycoriella hygida TaxID=35572 RepID=A0A9Q0MZH3_9DIPT|nr:hypothetical protein Bhyg_05856 [Pseudolycoriella hygida]